MFLVTFSDSYSHFALSKFPGNPDATSAFQKVSVAYDVLSNPSSKRTYDSRPAHSHPKYDFFAQSSPHADETLKGVLLSVFSEFLKGDFEMIRTLLSERISACVYHILISPPSGAIGDLNPSLELGDDGVNSVLSVLLSVRKRVLSKSHVTQCITDLTSSTNSLPHLRRCPSRRTLSRPRDTKRLPPACLLRYRWQITAHYPTNSHHHFPACYSRKCHASSIHSSHLRSSYVPRP
jgi:curved DNA-binding protein CbpA